MFYTTFITAGKLDKAWKYLQEAQELDKEAKKHPGSQSSDYIKFSGAQIREIFNTNFFGSYHGSESAVPVFIVGMMRLIYQILFQFVFQFVWFYIFSIYCSLLYHTVYIMSFNFSLTFFHRLHNRSGSTLLETMLDSHPNVWGMGEDSIFNGNLPKLRDEMVAASQTGGQNSVDDVLAENAEYVIRKMKDRAKIDFQQNPKLHGNRTIKSVKKITDKMLFNYKNLGTYVHPCSFTFEFDSSISE